MDSELYEKFIFIMNNHLWSFVAPVVFVLGACIGSFLNVVIWRMPRGVSVVFPPSSCPVCEYKIPGYLNMPIVAWLVLGGKCANCKTPIPVRYVLYEILCGLFYVGFFLICRHNQLPLVAFIPLIFFAGFLICASFIDLEHFRIPNQLNYSILILALIFALSLPQALLFHPTWRQDLLLLSNILPRSEFFQSPRVLTLCYSLFGSFVGFATLFGFRALSNLLLAKKSQDGDFTISYHQNEILLNQEKINFDEFLAGAIELSTQVENITLTHKGEEKSYSQVDVTLGEDYLYIEDTLYEFDTLDKFEYRATSLTAERETLGLGDVKMMATVGAFLGPVGVIFTIGFGSIIGLFMALATIILKGKKQIPFGPSLALAALLWLALFSFLNHPEYGIWKF